MFVRTTLLLALVGCGNSGDPTDASTDVVADGGDAAITDAIADAAIACKTGLPDAQTSAVVCGSTSCTDPDVCCIGQTAQCTTSCGNVSLVWGCDRSAHCGAGSTCCFDGLFADFTTCPGGAGASAPSCRSSTASCPFVACQTDADCTSGQACYAVFIEMGDAASRTIGLCH